MNIKTHSRKFAGKSAFASCYKVKALYNFAKRMRIDHETIPPPLSAAMYSGSTACTAGAISAADVLLDTASRHAILLDAQSGRVLAQKRADERTAPASLTKMMTVLLAIEAEPDLDKQVTLPEDIFSSLTDRKSIYGGLCTR